MAVIQANVGELINSSIFGMAEKGKNLRYSAA